MTDQDKTKEQLINELEDLRRRVVELEVNDQGGESEICSIPATTQPEKGLESSRSQAILSAAIECLPFEFFAIGPDGRYILQNAVSRQNFGNSIGKQPGDCAPDEHSRELWLANNRRAFAGERVEEEVETHIGGRTRTYYNIISPIQDGGEVCGILGVNVDITERKQAEEALRQSEYRQGAILDTIPDPAWLKDKEGRFLAVNAAWCRFIGMDAESVLGKTGFESLPAEVAAKFAEQDRDVIRSGQPLQCEELLTDKDGRLVWFETIKTPLYDDHGEVVGTSGLARDITGRKMYKREIERLNRLYAALSELNQIIVRVKSREELLREVCRITTEKAGFQLAWIGCPEIETQRVIPLASAGSKQDYLDEIKVYADDRPEGRGPTGTSIREGRVYVVNDFERDPSTAPWHAAIAKRGFRTSAALPIRFRGKVWGALTVYDGEPDVIQDKEIALLDEASAAISLALENLDHESQRKQAEDRVIASEANLREAQELARLGSYHLDIPRGCWTSSEALDRIFDIPAEYVRTLDGWGNLVHPDQRQAMLDYFRNEVFGNRKPFDREYRIVRHGDKQVRWVHGLGRLQFDTAGQPTAMLGTIQDITERKRVEQYAEIGRQVLVALNEPGSLPDSIGRVLDILKTGAGFDAVGIRLRAGEDFPYFAHRGFSHDFLLSEDTLLEQAPDGGMCRDQAGAIRLECTCGLVIAGKTDPTNPFFTPGGSFWTNDSAPLLYLPPDQDPRYHPRNQCIHVGYASVALIPLRTGDGIVGLLQFNDRRKGRFTPALVGILESCAAHIGEMLMRKWAEEALRESEERHRTILQTAMDGFWVVDTEARLLEVNDAYCRMSGYSRQELLTMHIPDLEAVETGDDTVAHLHKIMALGEDRFESRHRRKDGNVFDVEVRGQYQSIEGGRFVAFLRDITERKRVEQEKLEMERRLLHAQKLESIGVLAGGIAHDFNNILAGIMGYADLARLRLPESEPAREDIEVIKKAAQRAADLTRQILAYSGKGKFIVEPVDLSRVVEDSKKILAMSVSKKARVTYSLTKDLPVIQADAAQMGQVVMNLVINASEALGEQDGVIAVSTNALPCNAKDLVGMGPGQDLPEGLYVCLEVGDTGCGMDQQTLAKIFDPFFTTKFTGRGLGLAAVHGIIRGHKGAIQVSSEPGKGTTFRVLLPASGPANPAVPSEPAAISARGSGTVLVVDDEEVVRTLAERMIEQAGFSVLAASGGREAIRLFREHQHEVSCVLLDLTMPDLDGAETFVELRRIRADVRVVLSSGYSEEVATQRFAGEGLAGFIQKPYQHDTLIAQIQVALGSSELPGS